MEDNKSFYSKGEEIANAITHGIGTLLAIAALVLLIVFAAKYGDAWYVVSYTIYGVCLVLLYLFSTLYHSICAKGAKKVFRIFDHASIYILIAGTYTPFALTALRKHGGWVIFGVVWGATLIGIVTKVFFCGKFEKMSTLLYVVMGWMIVFYIKTLISVIPLNGVILLVAGGIIYTLGAVLFLFDKIPYNHAIWHLFVISGSACHFFCILLYLIR
ncbi:PAQR family membrane homeostasis protein TrhA [Clostridium guangxiense]|uniref:PAQR family membrane homeostasis protein TrhA n=1 Tax=Clostridium guangxiense TaxID=1662055 RepID=UPI001E3FB562|nr:hemolysin III family protein [Clostridium guangxiense]MCD2347337.1 hemolysin III family protein [Clostridium guangxiense]